MKPGEDDTTPWRVWLPRGHVSVDDLPDRMHYHCPKTLDRHIFFLPKTNPVQDELDDVTEPNDPVRELAWWESQYESRKKDLIAGPDCGRMPPTPDELKYFEGNIRRLGGDPECVQHETWLEYHDRLVKEYYDVNAEWALVKEICPELDRPEPALKPVRPRRGLHPYHGVAAAETTVGLLNLWIGSTAMAIFWFALGMMFLALADGRSRH